MLPLLIQAGVDIGRLKRHARRGLNKVWKAFNARHEYLVVSSTYEGDHIAGSLHYADHAFDTYPPLRNPTTILNDCKQTLGKDWDIITHPDHWHFEYDPG